MKEEVVEVAAGFCGSARVPAPVKPLAETFPFLGFGMAGALKVAPHRVMVRTLKNLCVQYLHPWLRKLGPNPRPSNLTLTLNPKPQAQPCDPTLIPGPQETLRPNPQPLNLTIAPNLKPQTLHLNVQPQPLNPTPLSLRAKPKPQNPSPKTVNLLPNPSRPLQGCRLSSRRVSQVPSAWGGSGLELHLKDLSCSKVWGEYRYVYIYR